MDPSGKAYIAGSTVSTDFPATSGSYATSSSGGRDAFVARLKSPGNSFDYATYLGGSGDDFGSGIAIDASSNAYIGGTTKSSDFPTTSGAYDETYNGGTHDAFAAKLSASGSILIYASYLGEAIPIMVQILI